MFTTAPTGTTRPAHEETVRLRPGDLPIRPLPNTLVGSLIFGLVLGLAFLKAPRGRDRSEWTWPPLPESALVKRLVPTTSKTRYFATRGMSSRRT